MERKKILIISESPILHTGLAKVTKEIWSSLAATGKYEIKCIGLYHPENAKALPFPVYSTQKDEHGKFVSEDRFGFHSFPEYVDEFKPDLVWTCGDMWMLGHVANARNRDSFHWIGYVPIDGAPLPSKYVPFIENMDLTVTYGKYGMKVIEKEAKKANLTHIYHGVNPQVFRPLSEEEKIQSKKNLLKIDPRKIVIGIVARNTPRKAFNKVFEAYFYLLSGSYFHCNECEKISVFPYDLITHKVSPVKSCHHCHSTHGAQGKQRDDVRLYIHAAIQDSGWNFVDLQNDYQLLGKIHVNTDLKIGFGLSEEKLNEVYNAFDIFTLPSRGEAFGLPILEAMSAGVPIVVTDYSAYPEWAKGCGEFVAPIAFEAEPVTNIRRAIINMDDYVESLLRLINNQDLRKEYGTKGRETALTMDWASISTQWEEVIDHTLSKE